jgi:NitT/TauT family transport system ATP-binding protein
LSPRRALVELAETLAAAPYNGRADLMTLADKIHLDVNDLYQVADALQLLNFARIEGDDLKLTDAGKQLAEYDDRRRERVFRERLLAHIPLARRIIDAFRRTHALGQRAIPS